MHSAFKAGIIVLSLATVPVSADAGTLEGAGIGDNRRRGLLAGCRLKFGAWLAGWVAMNGNAETRRVGVGHGMASGA